VVPLSYRGQEPPITILELVSIGPGNTRIKRFLSDQVFKRYLVATEFYEPATQLPPHQLVVNAIGDAEVAAAALTGARSLLIRSTAPVINKPAAVEATRRTALSSHLAAVPGVVAPRAMNLPRESLASPQAARWLERHGFVFPMLVRAPGFHSEERLVRVNSAAELTAAVDRLPGRDLTVVEFLDARSDDQLTRKYRVMMVDGRLYPLHAAAAPHWKVHDFDDQAADEPRQRAAEAEFLRNMSGVLGSRALRVLEETQKTLGLDYGGLDFGLSREGEVLLFEANAAMPVTLPEADPRWDYRRPAVEEVARAVRRMLMERARRHAGAPN
jgi:hypothetical protein